MCSKALAKWLVMALRGRAGGACLACSAALALEPLA